MTANKNDYDSDSANFHDSSLILRFQLEFVILARFSTRSRFCDSIMIIVIPTDFLDSGVILGDSHDF